MTIKIDPSTSNFIFDSAHFASSWEELNSRAIILSIFCLHLQAKKQETTQAKEQEVSVKSDVMASEFRHVSLLIVPSEQRYQFEEDMEALQKEKSIAKKSSLILPPFLDGEKGVSLFHVGGRIHRPFSRHYRPFSRRYCPSNRRHRPSSRRRRSYSSWRHSRWRHSRWRHFRWRHSPWRHHSQPHRFRWPHSHQRCLFRRPRVFRRRYSRGKNGKKSSKHPIIQPRPSLTKNGWQYLPPSSPLSGGLSMNVDVFHSLAIDADGLVDPCPPAPLHNDPDEFDRITPNSLLLPLVTNTKTTTKTLPPPSDSPPPIILHYWQHVRILVNAFW